MKLWKLIAKEGLGVLVVQTNLKHEKDREKLSVFVFMPFLGLHLPLVTYHSL